MYEYKVKLLRVLDGDTIEVAVDLGFKVHKTETLRLYGVNTPETNSSDPSERAKAQEAKIFVERYLGSAVEIRVQTEKPYESDKYGRWLGRVSFLNNLSDGWHSLNEELIKNKLGVEYFGGKR